MSLEWIVPDQIGLYRGPACVGIIKGLTGWILIDSTVETAAVKKIVKALPETEKGKAVHISAIINTHAHADHCGGNAWISNTYQSSIYASALEKVYIESTFLEPHYLFSAESPKALKNKFFMAEPSKVTHEIVFQKPVKNEPFTDSHRSQTLIVDGVSLQIHKINGHSIEMIGIETESGQFFCGDLLFTPMILDKHPMLFLHDLEAFMESLKWCRTKAFNGVILTHGGYFEEHESLCDQTLHRLEENTKIILGFIDQPIDEWTLHQKVAKVFELEENLGGWHLNHGVIRSYLNHGLTKDLIKWENGLYAPF